MGKNVRTKRNYERPSLSRVGRFSEKTTGAIFLLRDFLGTGTIG